MTNFILNYIPPMNTSTPPPPPQVNPNPVDKPLLSLEVWKTLTKEVSYKIYLENYKNLMQKRNVDRRKNYLD